MNKNTNYIRKVIYIALIGVLLVPLSFLSRPTTRDSANKIQDDGGVISQLRNEYELSQAKLSEIDATSEALRFSLLGMRGIASTTLWLKAIDTKNKEDWNGFEATLNTLVKIQPNFVKVWEFQAHNLSYNVSVEFDDYEFRYAWVTKGIEFLTRGIPYNRRDHRITDNLGFFTGQKIGRSDERVQFRQMFRNDKDFHEVMTAYPFIHLDDRGDGSMGFDTLDFGPDNWLLSHQWYRRSREMVENGVEGDQVPKHSYDFLFYMWSPAQLRNHIMSLQDEERPVDSFREKWAKALDHWLEYGQREMRTSFGTRLTLEGMAVADQNIAELRKQLDEIAPAGLRQKLEDEARGRVKLTDEEKAALAMSPDERNEETQRLARAAQQKIYQADQDLDKKIAEQCADALEGKRLVQEIYKQILKQHSIDKYSNTTNYVYWKNRALGESTDLALEARLAMYAA
jgi:hypothetical protein